MEKGQKLGKEQPLSGNESANISCSNIIEKEHVRHEDNHYSMDDIFHLDSIPGLANILADDSIDPTPLGDHSILEQNQRQDYIHQQQSTNDYLGGGSKFSQFFQQDSKQILKPNRMPSPQFRLDGTMNLKQDQQGFKGRKTEE